jgi:hypothetical protein
MTGRRMFLRGAGGAALAIPCLTSLLPRRARAAYTPPRRFVAMAADHGVIESAWYPTGYKRQLPVGQTYTERDLVATPGPVSSTIGAPFDGLRRKLLLLRGLDSALYFPNTQGHVRATTLCGTYLNGQHPGNSIDIVLSRSPKVVLAGTTIAHVSCGVYGQNHAFAVSGGSMKAPFMYADGKQLFDYLFGSSSAGFAAPRAEDPALFVRRRTLLIDSVLEHYRSVSTSPKLASDDRRVLDDFVSGFASVEQRLKTQKPPTGCQVKAPAFAAYTKDDVTKYETRIGDMLDTLSLALRCGVVQVAHFGFPTPEDSRPPPDSNYAVFNQLNTGALQFTRPIHDYSHAPDEHMSVFQRWLTGMAARFLASLDVQESVESPATFLDNSLVMYHNNLSNGSLHLRYDLPVLLAGSLGGRFATGRFVDFTQNVAHTVQNASGKYVGVDYNRLLVTLLQGFGLTESDYQQPGQPPGFGSDARHDMLSAALDTSKRRLPLPGILAG